MRPGLEIDSSTLLRLIEEAPFATVIYEGPSHRVAFVNARHDEMTAGRVVVGKTLAEALPELVGQSLWQTLERVYRTGERSAVREAPTRLVREGELKDCWFDVTLQPMRDGAGRISGVLVTAVEVTEHVLARQRLERAAELLRESERQFRELVDNLPELAWSAGPDGHIDFYNRRWYEYTGTTFEQMQGWGWQSVHEPEVLPRVIERWKLSIATGQPFEMEFPLRRADGQFGWFLTRVRPMRDSKGIIIRWFGTNTEVTALRDAEERARVALRRVELLSRSSALLMRAKLELPAVLEIVVQQVVSGLGEGAAVVLVSKDGEHLEVAACRHPDEAVVAKIFAELAKDPLRRGKTISGRVIETGEAVLLGEGRLVAVPLRTTREVLGALHAIRPRQAVPFTEDDKALLQEIADRAALSIEAAQRYAEAKEAVRIREDFLAIASHELRTPLTALQLHLEGTRRLLARRERVEVPEIAAKVEGSLRQTARLSKLVDGLLDVSRISQGKLTLALEEIDLAEVAREVVQRLSLEAQAAGSSLTLSAASKVVGRWDPIRIEQVFTNLVGNAIKYGAGKPIAVKVEPLENAALITVKDLGIGISPEDLGRLFGRFARAVSSQHFGGLGLGLYISRQIVEAHGGAIEVQSEVQQGTVFTVTLPR